MSNLFLQDLCAALVLSFGHFLWIGTLIAIVAAVVARRRTTAAARYGVWLGGLIAMAVSPFITLVVLMAMPSAVTSVDAVTDSGSAALVAESVGTATHGNAASDARRMDALVRPLLDNDRLNDDKRPLDANEDGRTRASILQGEGGANGSTDQRPTTTDAPLREPAWWREYAPVVTSLYLIGVALMGLRLAFGLWGGRRLRSQATLITERSLLDALQRQADALGMALVPALAYCERVAVPTVLGILKPMILLPVSVASGLAPDQIESVLAHELAHLRRYDHLVNLMQCVIESLLFFHPAVWWVSRRVRDEREHCCDDLVIACGAVPLDYAASLLRVAELSREAERQRGHNQRRSFTAVSLFATGDRPSTLRQRIARLLGYQTELNVRAVSPWVLFCLATCCVGAIWLLSSMTFVVLAEINRDRSQKTVIVTWSAVVDDSVMNEIRAINGLATSVTGAMQTPDDAKFSTLRCSAEELRAILKNHADNKRLVALQKNIRHSMPTGGWRIGGEKRFFQMIDSETIETKVVHDPGYHVNWYADGHETRDEDSDRARLIVDGKFHFTQMGHFSALAAKDIETSDGAPKLQYGNAESKTTAKFDSVMSDGEATVVVLSPPAVIRQYQELVMDDKGQRFEAKTKQAPKLHAIFVHEAVRVPVKQLDQFHKLTRVEDWVRRGPAETKEHVTRIAEWRARPSRSVSVADEKWTRPLPNGGHVQLVGLGRPNEARMIWWTPEGEPLFQVSDTLGQSLSGMELTAIVRVWEDGVSRKLPPPKGMVHSGGVMDVPDTFPNRGSQLLVLPAVVDKETGKVSLKIGAGFGAWTAETKIDSAAESTATLSGIEIKTGTSHESHTFGPAGPPNLIKATSSWINWKPKSDLELDAIAVARDGTPHPSTSDPVVYSNENHGGAQYFTHHLPKVDLQHFVIKSRPVHWTEFTDFAIEPAVALVPPLELGKEQEKDVRPFSAKLPGGVTVNLVGVGMSPTQPPEWWQADGSRLAKRPNESLDGYHSNGFPNQADCREIALEILGLPQDHSVTARVGNDVAGVAFSNFKNGVKAYNVASGPFSGVETTSVHVSLRLEPLVPAQGIDAEGRKLAEVEVPLDLKPLYDRVQSIRVESRNDQQELLLKPLGDLLVNPDWRIFAIDTNGKEVRPSTTSTNGEGTTYGFKLARESLARFEYRLRPYRHWVTFENVSLHPGKKTEVKVTVTSAPKPQHYIANLPDGHSVEFIGITKNTAPANEGWKADGTPIGDAGYWPATTYISGNTVGTFIENGKHPEPNAGAIDLLFRFRGLKAQPSLSFQLAANGGSYSHWPVKDPYELRVAAQRRGPSAPGNKWTIPDGEMRVGLTDEPWGRYVKISPEGKTLDPIQPDERHASTYGLIEVLGTRPHDRAPTGNTVVLRRPLTDAHSPENNAGSTDLLHRYAFEFRAIDTDGKNHWANAWFYGQVPNTKLMESQYGLMQPLPAGATLSHYEYRLRPYRHWVTFTGVSLEPGKESDVRVKAEEVPRSETDDRLLTKHAEEQLRTVVGTVVSPAGKPVAGIEVLAFKGGEQLEQKFETDERGQIRVSKEWRETEHWLTLVARDGRDRLGWFDFMIHGHSDIGQKAEDGSFKLVLLPMSRTVRGRLVDEAGMPLAQVPVLIRQLDHDINQMAVHWRYQSLGGEPLVRGGVTDNDGRFEVKVPADSTVWLRAKHPDWVEQTIIFQKENEDSGETKLVRAAKVSGRVTDARNGKPLAGVVIAAQATKSEIGESSGDEAKTDADGNYLITGLRAATYTIHLKQSPFKTLTAAAHTGVEVKAGESHPADFAFNVGQRLTGRVLHIDTGKPIANCKVNCTNPAHPIDSISTETDEKGEFEFFVPPGKSNVSATEGRRFGNDSERDVDVPTEGDVAPITLTVGEKIESVPGSFKISVGKPLERKVRLDFKDEPFAEALKLLCDSAIVTLELDEAALTSAGYSKETPVTLTDDNPVTLQDALTRFLKPFDKLAFTFDKNKVFVSTREQVEAREKQVAEPKPPTEEKKSGATSLPKGLEFLKPYPKLHGLSLDMTEPQFLEIVKQQELKTRKTGEGDKTAYHIGLGDGLTLIVMFRDDGTCRGIQRIRGEDNIETSPPVGLEFLKPYPKLHGLSLDMTEPQFLEIVKQQELKTRKTVEGAKVTHHITLGDGHTLIVMFDKDAKCSGIQRVRGEDSSGAGRGSNANGDLRSNPAAGSGDPRRAQPQIEKPTAWTSRRPDAVESKSKETAEILDDGSVQMSLPSPNSSNPQLKFQFKEETAIDSVRLEVLPDLRFADRRLGRIAGRELFLFEFKPHVLSADGKLRSFEWKECRSLQDAEDDSVAHLIDYATDTGWKVPPLKAGQTAHELVFRMEEPLVLKPGDALLVDVDSGGSESLDTLARFRVSFPNRLPPQARSGTELGNEKADAAKQSVEIRLVGGPKAEPLPKVQVEFTTGYGSNRKSFGTFTTDEAGWLKASLPVEFYELDLKSDKEWPYLPVEKPSGGRSAWQPNVRVTGQGVEKWLGGNRCDKGFELATNERPARITFILEPAVELVIRAVDVETGEGIAGAGFHEAILTGEELGHPVYGENLGSKFPYDRNYDTETAIGPEGLTDKNGYSRRWAGEQSARSKIGIRKWPAGYKAVEPHAVVSVLGQARVEQVFKFRRIRWAVRVEPEKKKVALGEPLTLRFFVKNATNEPRGLELGGDYRNRLGRPESFEVTVINNEAKKMPVPDAGPTLGGISSNVLLKPDGETKVELKLSDWATITQPGNYRVFVKRTLKLFPIKAQQGDRIEWGDQPEVAEVAASCEFDVIAPRAAVIDANSEPNAERKQSSPQPTTSPPVGLEFLKPYPKLHGLSLDMTEPQFLEIVKQQELKTRKIGEGDKTAYHIGLGDGLTLIVMFRNDGTCRGIQRIRGEDAVDETISLAEAVRDFNAENKQLGRGLDQPAMTEDEVIAVIKRDQWKRGDPWSLNEKEIAAFKAIAESKRLPKGSYLDVDTEDRAETFLLKQLWQVRLMLPAIGHDGFVGLTIRDTFVAEEKIDPKNVAWGKPDSDGLSLGAYLSPRKTQYALGDRVRLRLFVRNDSTKPVGGLTFLNVTTLVGEDFTVTDQTGAKIAVSPDHDVRVVGGATGGALAPGDVHAFNIPGEISIGGDSSKNRLVGPVIDAKPGQTLQLKVRAHNGNDRERKAGEVEPESGVITLVVKDAAGVDQ